MLNSAEQSTIRSMKFQLALYFLMIATIQFGLLFGVLHYLRPQNQLKPSLYWIYSLLLNAVTLTMFGVGILGVENVVVPGFIFTLSNTLFISSALLQALFCRLLVSPLSNQIKITAVILVLLSFCVIEYLRHFGNFEQRTMLMVISISSLLVWQLVEQTKIRKQIKSPQLLFLKYATYLELAFLVGRFLVIVSKPLAIKEMPDIPVYLIFFTVGQIVMNTISYIAIGGFWAEKIALANFRTSNENEEIKSLLTEREQLIASLLKANKTAVTGALSASIAHELNQPLGASNLNIQFLKKKLEQNELSRELELELLNALENDNRRAASIVHSLRAIFTEEELPVEQIEVSKVIDSMLSIVHPELKARRIDVSLDFETGLVLETSGSDLQQIFLNLVTNSINSLANAQQDYKSITISAKWLDAWIEFAVIDNGPGVSEEAQSHLFELLSDSKTGMGLGLWLCKHIVTKMGGTIWYQTSTNRGACFKFRIPQKLTR